MTEITAKNFKNPVNGFLPPSTTELVVSGIKTYVYGLKELKGHSDQLAILYLAHGRGRTHQATEKILKYVISQYNKRSQATDLIGVTIDMRNHGERLLDIKLQEGWPENPTHGPDMISEVFGDAQDYTVIAQFLPAYLPQCYNKVFNIMSGISLGGHTTWRTAVTSNNLFDAYAPIIGCPNLSRMMIERLQVELPESLANETTPLNYEDVEAYMTDDQKEKWPRHFANIVYENDVNISNIDRAAKPILVLNGGLDPLVPNRFSIIWNSIKPSEKVTLIAQDNAGHQCTLEMVNHLENWVSKLLEK